MLRQAFASSESVLAAVSAGQMDEQTPCAQWKVRDLVNHLVGGTTFFAAAAKTGTPPAGDGEADFTAGDYLGAFKDGSAQAVAAFAADGTMERIIHLPFADLPGSAYINIAAIDTFTHGWDLAKATGQSTDLNPALAAQLLAIAEGFLPDALRGPEGKAPFGPKVEVDASAAAADRLAGFMGRQP
jgi:uncharacterized protein (TIGR03086 family)